MKTFVTLALTLVLTASLLVGCGCTNQNGSSTSAPTVLPTNEELWNTTESTTRATTESTTVPTTNSSTNNTTGGMNGTTENGGVMENGSGNGGSMDNTTGSTMETEGALSRSARRMMPGSR